MTPRLSIIISVHNDALFIVRKLESLSAADMRQAEVVFVTDTDGDDVRAVEAWLASHPSAGRIVRIGPTTLYGAWNAGIEAAAGEFVAYSNCDDSFHPRWPQSIISHMDATGADAAHTLTLFQPLYDGADTWSPRRMRSLHPCRLPGPNCTWRRGLHVRFDASLRICGDLAFYAELASGGYHVNIHAAPEYLMTVHGRNLSTCGSAQAVITAEKQALGNPRWPQSVLDQLGSAIRNWQASTDQ